MGDFPAAMQQGKITLTLVVQAMRRGIAESRPWTTGESSQLKFPLEVGTG
jgi:hypothetical protein